MLRSPRNRSGRRLVIILGPLLLLAFAAVVSWRPAARPEPLRRSEAPTAVSCPSLQALVDEATAGTIVVAPACQYRETLTIRKPLTLIGQPGAEIRGSDLWTNWRQSGRFWIEGPLPAFPIHGPCEDGTIRCSWPEQVFLDGQPLTQVAAEPVSGQFALDGARNVVLADDPAGRTVEVTTRRTWITGSADNVTVQGFTMKHAANDAQQGAISNGERANWTIQDNILSDAHGAVVSISRASGLKVLNNDITRGGQLGVHGYRTSGALIANNRVHGNNTEAFSTSWEAGGLKLVELTDPILDGNEVWGNNGPGIWCDIDCNGAVISNNRVWDNRNPGIVYEISHGGKIYGNKVWGNGWENPDWGVGAGILCDVCDRTEISGNLVAWNANGITVISQDRSDGRPVVQVHVHDNRIISGLLPRYSTALAWNQNWDGPLFRPASNNRGSGNAYWFASPEGRTPRFAWGDLIDRLAAFNATPGEEGGRYLTATEKDEILSAAGIPASHPSVTSAGPR